MLKKFFISMLGTMAGLWLSLIILFLGTIFAVTFLITKSVLSSSSPSIKGDKILYLDLAGNITERQGGASMSDILNYMDDPVDDLENILMAIRLASDDKKISGLFINGGGAQLGVASRSEIISAIKGFKEKGKFVYAYSDNFDQGDYYVASVADSLFLNPVGSVNVHGLSSTTIFYKDLLDKVGVDVNVIRVGAFKSAVEPYMRMSMSPESREQTSVFVNNIWSSITEEIAGNRDLKSADVVNFWADSLAFTWAPERYVEQSVVSALHYRSEVDDLLRSKMDVDSDEDVPLISISDYMAVKASDLGASSSNHIAVLYAVGDITESASEGIASNTMVPEIQKLAKDDNVKALVLRVNSGGGSAFASEQIWKALEDFKTTGKPFYVSMGDYAASGGYYISCGADKIYCDAATLTGSIGIFGMLPNAQRLLENKVGLGFETVETNANSNFPSLVQMPTAAQLNAMQRYVERGYETFTSRVAAGRDLPVDSVKAIGGGRVWDGALALDLGLVDKIGGLWDCIDDIAAEVDLDTDKVVSYPHNDLSFLETLLKESKGKLNVDIDAMSLEMAKEYLDDVARIKSMAPIQARMEKIYIK